jgi:hypothetical protein
LDESIATAHHRLKGQAPHSSGPPEIKLLDFLYGERGDIWVVYLGSVCEKEQWRHIIHRRTRCDLSLFQLGLRFLEYLLNEEMSIPVQFHVTI